ncbi:hypothetical protein ACOME3_005030 [Neoechinorhynchus agilis]
MSSRQKQLDLLAEGKIPFDLSETREVQASEVRSIYRCASNKIKRILKEECSILFECKMCKQVLRSFEGFLYHRSCVCGDAAIRGRDKLDDRSQRILNSMLQPIIIVEFMNLDTLDLSNGY